MIKKDKKEEKDNSFKLTAYDYNSIGKALNKCLQDKTGLLYCSPDGTVKYFNRDEVKEMVLKIKQMEKKDG